MLNILQIIIFVLIFIRINNCLQIPKIVDGVDCHSRDYPYLISLSSVTRGIYCGGSLLNRYNVLTAGHCCNYTRHKEQIKVYAGISERRSDIQIARAWRRIIHPYLDLCIIKLFSPIESTSHTSFTKLATTEIFDVLSRNNSLENCITLGFGIQNIIYQNGTVVPNPNASRRLQCVQQKIRLTGCWNYFLCGFGQDRPTQDACKGDSGSPLLCQAIQVGFVVSGTGCGLGLPAYYMSIPEVYDYIIRISHGNMLHPTMITLTSIMRCFNILSEIH